jgi:hypothetical protein
MTSDDIKRQLEILEEKRNALYALSLRRVENSNVVLDAMQNTNEHLKNVSTPVSSVKKSKRSA